MRGFGNPQGKLCGGVHGRYDGRTARHGSDGASSEKCYDSIRPLASTVSLRYMRPCGVYGKGAEKIGWTDRDRLQKTTDSKKCGASEWRLELI